MQVQSASLGKNLAQRRTTKRHRAQRVRHIRDRRMHLPEIQHQLAVKACFFTGLAQHHKFVGRQPDKGALADCDSTVVLGKRFAAGMLLHTRQDILAAAKVDLAEMRQFGDGEADAAAIRSVDCLLCLAGQSGTARRTAAFVCCASH